MKVLCVGHASYDITFPVEEFIKENTKNRLTSKIECGGGPASNAAYLLSKYGVETYFMGIIGNDYYGKKIIDELKSVNVNTKYINILDNYDTTVSNIIANTSNGSRTILTYRDNTKEYILNEIDFKPDIILFDGQEINASHKLIDKFKDAITIIDAGRSTEDIINLSKRVKYLVCSKEFAENVTNLKFDFENMETLLNIYIRMEEIFNNVIVITLEDKGCLYKIDDNLKIMPSIKVKPLDSTGAGDLFHGAFTYALSKGYDFESILKISNIVGALSTTKIGSRYSIPEKEEVKNHYELFR